MTMNALPTWKDILRAAADGALETARLEAVRTLFDHLLTDASLREFTLSACNAKLTAGVTNQSEEIWREHFSAADLPRAYLLVTLMCHDEARANFAANGYPVEAFDEVWTDLQSWVNHNLRAYGEAGLQRRFYDWYNHHLRSQLVQFGRLQFQLNARFDMPRRIARGADGRLLAVAHGESLPSDSVPLLEQGDSVIAIHIPEGRPGWLPMTPDECQRSIRRFREFAAHYCTSIPWRALYCHSWLLDEALVKPLPPQSNIAQFMRLGGGLYLPGDKPKSEALWRLFGDAEWPSDGAPLTALQRAAVAAVKAGIPLAAGGLVIPRS